MHLTAWQGFGHYARPARSGHKSGFAIGRNINSVVMALNGCHQQTSAGNVSGNDFFNIFATAVGHRAPLWAVFVNQTVIIKEL